MIKLDLPPQYAYLIGEAAAAWMDNNPINPHYGEMIEVRDAAVTLAVRPDGDHEGQSAIGELRALIEKNHNELLQELVQLERRIRTHSVA